MKGDNIMRRSRDNNLKNVTPTVRNKGVYQNTCGISKVRDGAGKTGKIAAQARKSMQGSFPQFTLETQLLPRECR
jgi:hypothetical protein